MGILPSAIPQESRKAGGPRAGFKNGAGPRPRVSSVARRFAGTRYVFREEGSSFVPDGLVPFLRDHPAMNRRAIFGRPCGTWVHGVF